MAEDKIQKEELEKARAMEEKNKALNDAFKSI